MLTTRLCARVLPAAILAFAVPVAVSAANVRITEYQYTAPTTGEFIEFTNLDNTAVDFTGWSFDDDSRTANPLAGAFDLSAFGLVAPGESVVIAEISAADFRTSWGLDASVKVLGGYTNNLGRNDEINLYDNGVLVDRLTYGDGTFPGSVRANDGHSAHPASAAALGANDIFQWVLSSSGDSEGSFAALAVPSNFGSPGQSNFAPVPIPAALPLLGSALLGLFGLRRRT